MQCVWHNNNYLKKTLSNSTENVYLQQKLNAAYRFGSQGNIQELVLSSFEDMELMGAHSQSSLSSSDASVNQELKQD